MLSPREPTCSVIRRLCPTSSATWRSATSRSAERFSIRKKLLSAGPIRSGWVNLAGAKAIEQRLRRQVDHHDFVRAAQDVVGDRLAYAHTSELGDRVVERLQVLDVERRQHVDSGIEHVVDVLVSLRVLEARRVGVGELVDQAQLGRPHDDPRQVHLLDLGAAVLDPAAGDHR